MSAVIYKIENLLNGKVYIGSTTDFNRRRSQHLARLRAGKHHCIHLQNAWNRDGEINFAFEVLECFDVEDRIAVEETWIARMDALNRERGYNKAEKVGRSPGFAHTDEGRYAMSRVRKGVRTPRREAAWRVLPEFNRGKKHSLERIEKVRKALIGRTIGASTRALLSKKLKGRKHKPEAVEKIRAAGIGRRSSPETREKCAAWQRGVPKPREQVERQRAALKGRFLGAERYNALAVVQLDLEGRVIAWFESGATAARATGCYNTLITNVIKGKLAKTGGFMWRRIEQLTPEQTARLEGFRDAEI